MKYTIYYLILCIIPVLLLAGCSHKKNYLTNEEIIMKVKECTDAGLDTREITNFWNYETVKVICKNKDN